MENTERQLDAIDRILDENDNKPVVLYDENGKAIEFEQLAVIPLDEKMYVILRPNGIEGIAENEAIVFELQGEPGEEEKLRTVTEMDVIDEVFKVYYALADEAGYSL